MADPATGIEAAFRLTYAAPSASAFSLDVDLALPGRGITAIFGHSGSGKTTLLRCIAGLQKAQSGRLRVNGIVWEDESCFLRTSKRPLGFVFQESSLFPHLTGSGNLAFAVKRSGQAQSAGRHARVVSLMGIAPVLDHYPAQMSAGERQRVAISRALLIAPSLLLMDEPLASLDSARKQEILPYLERLHEEVDIPILYVSHAVDEVARLADHLVILDRGKVVADGALTDVLARADLPIGLGEDAGAVLSAEVVERDLRWHLLRAIFDGGELWLRDGGEVIGQQIRVRILARDVSLALHAHDDNSILNRLPARVMDIAPDRDEAMSLIRLSVGTSILIARLTRRSVENLQIAAGSEVCAQIKSVAIVR